MVVVKDVVGYEGLYIIDSLGNVVSLPKKQGRRLHNKYKILSNKVNKYGYKEVALAKDGAMKTILLHRLIAQHFVPNPKSLPQVNHKNGIKTDNRIENLEWCTKRENTVHAFQNNLSNFKNDAIGRIMRYNAMHGYCKVILSKDGDTHEFTSAKDAAAFIGTNSDEVTRAIRKNQRVKGWFAVGVKPEIANGEILTGNAADNPVELLNIKNHIKRESK